LHVPYFQRAVLHVARPFFVADSWSKLSAIATLLAETTRPGVTGPQHFKPLLTYWKDSDPL